MQRLILLCLAAACTLALAACEPAKSGDNAKPKGHYD